MATNRVAILFEGEAVVPSHRPLSIVRTFVPLQGEVPAAVQIARVSGKVVAEAVLLRAAAAGVSRGYGQLLYWTGLVGSWWALFAQRVGACHRNVVKLFK